MLDPLTALSVASDIIQLVDFGSKLLSQTQELYESAHGASKANITTEEVTADIVALSLGLRKAQNAKQVRSDDDIALEKLVLSCEKEANELLAIFDGLKLPRDEATKWHAFKRAIRSVRQKDKVEEIDGRLGKIQRQVSFHL